MGDETQGFHTELYPQAFIFHFEGFHELPKLPRVGQKFYPPASTPTQSSEI